MMQILGIVVDSSVWQVTLIVLGIVAMLAFVYWVYIHITYRMAKNRHRDPLGWVLLSIFVSPLLTWIILLIAGDANRQ